MGSMDYKVSELVSKIERGELQLPEMQRRYVWTSTKVRDLLDSLYRGYPSGMILAWQPPLGQPEVDKRAFQVRTEADYHLAPLLLLDGQQRLTSLSAVLRDEPLIVKNRRRPIEILFNLDHPDQLDFVTEVTDDEGENGAEADEDTEDEAGDEDASDTSLVDRMNRRAFVVKSNRIAALPNWVSVTDVFKRSDEEIFERAGLEGWGDPRYKKYSERLKALKKIADYSYRVEVLEHTMSYEEVTEIFVRVNSLGAKLRGSDLALAQITAKWRGSLAKFSDFGQAVKARGFDLDQGLLLRALVSLVTGQSRFASVSSLSKEDLASGWEDTKRAVDFALNYVRSNLGIDSPTYLSSPYLLITTAFWAHKHGYQIDPVASASFRKWFLIANAKGRYSRGSSESLLNQDLASLQRGGGVVELTHGLLQQVGRLDFTADELAGRGARSGAFRTLFLALRQDKAEDWASGLVISAKHEGKADKIEYHHIFPKDYLKTHRPDIDVRTRDEIGNLAFIGAQTNRSIAHRSPAVYRAEFDPGRLAKHLVYFGDGWDQAELFEEFLRVRRTSLARKLNEFLDLA